MNKIKDKNSYRKQSRKEFATWLLSLMIMIVVYFFIGPIKDRFLDDTIGPYLHYFLF